jgi:Fe-S cluster biogenesis protein NfuA
VGEPNSGLRGRVDRVLAEEAAPLLGMDGASVEVVEVRDGVARVRLHGGCSGCPGAVYAVLVGLEQELRRRVPEVEYLEAVP